MQTSFTLAQLADPKIKEAEQILRTCVHCGFCTATCPTYVLRGDELDSPRGRIYLIKDMLENGRDADERTVRHIDRCLSCLSCMTTCPSGVDYMHLVDHARAHIEKTYERPAADRWQRWMLAKVLPRPNLFRLALMGAGAGRPFARALPRRLKAMLKLAPRRAHGPSPMDRPGVVPAVGQKRARVALLQGCAQRVLDPAINEATIRLLTRMGCEVVLAKDAVCCGALTLHMGQDRDGKAAARRTIEAWSRELDGNGLDAVVINASGCGTTVKDYGHLFQHEHDHVLAERAGKIAALALDVTELVDRLGLPEPVSLPEQKVAYHSACSMQHGQKIKTLPQKLLRQMGFTVVEPAESHICCGSAGTYNILQPELADQLKERKVGHLEKLAPDMIATGNIGCMTQIGSGTAIPIVHTVELLDWATGGPVPDKLRIPAQAA
ncbi:glycolate oxidase subunit GlcF [Geminicoccus harenae]|uniref:glycolate oxidase subunit GlcF n=2 Tax=Geminicoccus harenae TaxID=2498453 RepID=UPI001C964485|nr:glycolate oxidase subunit GlcF [Geminicoccus harenae]